MSRLLSLAGLGFEWFMRVLPPMVLFSLFFVMEGNLKWLGLCGFLLLPGVFSRNCPACLMHRKDAPSGRSAWIGH